MGDISIEDYKRIDAGVGWLNLPKALVLALFAIVDALSEIRDELRKRQ